jgi:ATP-binding cassette subfamily B multidrug efflux pump
MSYQSSSQGSSNVRTVLGGRRPASPGKIEKARDPKRTLVRLLPYLGAFKLTLGLVLVFVILYTLLGLVGPYLMGVAIDRYISTKQLSGLAPLALWMLVTYLLTNFFQAAADWIMADISQRALKEMRRELFEHLQSLSLSFFDRNPAGELMSRLTNDIDAINQAVSQNVTSLFASVLSMVGILVAMFVLNVWLALASLVVVPIMFWFTNFVARYTRRGFRRLQMHLGEINSVMEESISGQKVVKAFRRNESALENFRRCNEEVFKAGVYANSYALLLMPITNQLGNLFVIVLAGFGGWLALQGLVSVGIIATFISYGQRFIQPLRQLANMYNSIQAALAGAERVFEIIETQPEVVDAPDAAPLETLRGEVRFEGVQFGYRPDTPVIKGMSLEAKAGQTVALVGPTGAGKTTIINLLTRFYEVDGGRITIDGTDIRQLKKADLRRQLGLVLQDTFLFADSVLENIRYGRLDASDEECFQAARLADADHFIRQLPQGYQTQLSERASNLSQATSSVDTRTEARIQESLLRLMAGRTSFVIAHRLSTIRDADQIIVIDNGEIVEQGTHQELLDRRGFFHHLYVSQFKGQQI